MDNIFLVFICLALGFGLQFLKSFPKNGYVALNHFVIYISLPALALYYIPKIEVSSALLYPIGVAWLGFALSFIFFFSLLLCILFRKLKLASVFFFPFWLLWFVFVFFFFFFIV